VQNGVASSSFPVGEGLIPNKPFDFAPTSLSTCLGVYLGPSLVLKKGKGVYLEMTGRQSKPTGTKKEEEEKKPKKKSEIKRLSRPLASSGMRGGRE